MTSIARYGRRSRARALHEFAREPQVDWAVMDQLMTGSQPAWRIRLDAPTMPVLIVSGVAELETSDARRHPMLSKLFERGALSRAIAELGGFSFAMVPFRRAGVR
jgi:hypothetical protein